MEKSTTFLVTPKDILIVRNPANVVWKLRIDQQNKFFGNMTNPNAPPHNSKKNSPPVEAMNNYTSFSRYIIHPGINLDP